MKYQINAQITVSCWTEVEADSEHDALNIAKTRSVAEVHIDGSYPEDECWHIAVDGEPVNIRVGSRDGQIP
jgi:hypothetical protein